MSSGAIRDATADDGEACASIYAPYVRDTSFTFETDPPSPAEMTDRIDSARRTHAWLVLEDQGSVVGYAYAAPFRSRSAYRWSCEVSVYLALGRRRTGAGRALYQALFDRLVARGYRTVVGQMTLPNPASEGLHRSLGFELVGVHRRIGFKHGRWHDVMITQRALTAEGDDTPPEPH